MLLIANALTTVNVFAPHSPLEGMECHLSPCAKHISVAVAVVVAVAAAVPGRWRHFMRGRLALA